MATEILSGNLRVKGVHYFSSSLEATCLIGL